jgi:hypothetical protein
MHPAAQGTAVYRDLAWPMWVAGRGKTNSPSYDVFRSERDTQCTGHAMSGITTNMVDGRDSNHVMTR